MTDAVTWLHISDTHLCNEKYASDSNEIVGCFFEDLKLMREQYNLRPDFIFFTGDLVLGQINNSRELSLKDQYNVVKEFLLRIFNLFPEVSRENVFIVPGNHDINNTVVTEAKINLLEYLRKNKQENGKEVNNSLIKYNNSHNSRWKELMENLGDYKNFLLDIGLRHLLEYPDQLTYSSTRNVNGFDIGIAGLNSALTLCGDDEYKKKLWLGACKISESFKKLTDSMLSIAVSHYSPDFFTNFKDRPINQFERNYNFFLHGHKHQEWVIPKNKHIRVACGTLNNNSKKENGYNFVRVYPSESRGEVFLRTYVNDKWTPNVIRNRTNNEGIWNLKNLNIHINKEYVIYVNSSLVESKPLEKMALFSTPKYLYAIKDIDPKSVSIMHADLRDKNLELSADFIENVKKTNAISSSHVILDSLMLGSEIANTDKLLTGTITSDYSKTFVRYPFLEYPNKIVIDVTFSLFVHLLVKPPKPDIKGVTIKDQSLPEKLPEVEMVVLALGFDIKGTYIKYIKIDRDKDCNERFILTPRKLGMQQIRVDFYQYGRRIGTERCDIKVTEKSAKKEVSDNYHSMAEESAIKEASNDHHNI